MTEEERQYYLEIERRKNKAIVTISPSVKGATTGAAAGAAWGGPVGAVIGGVADWIFGPDVFD